MSDPYLTASAAAHASTGIALPGTPEGDALELQGDLSRAAHDLRSRPPGGQIEDRHLDRIDTLLRRAADLTPHLAPGQQASLTRNVRELSAVRDRCVDEMRRGGDRPPSVQARPAPTARQRLEGRLTHAIRRLPRDPRSAVEHLSRAIHRTAGGQACLRALGGMDSQDLGSLMDRAGLHGAQRGVVRDAIDGLLGQAFHREVVRTAERAFERGVRAFERAARGGADFERLVVDLTRGPNPYPLLASLRNAGARDQTTELQRLVEATHIDPSRHRELAPAIRRAARAAVTTAAASLREHQRETFDDGDLLSDHLGLAYTSFPGAISLAAQRQGVPADRARSLSDGVPGGSTLLEHAAAAHISATAEAQRGARRTPVTVAVVAAVMIASVTTGVAGGCAIAMLAGAGLEAPEVAGAWAKADSLGHAAAVGLASEHAVHEAEVDRALTTAAALMGAAVEGGEIMGELGHVGQAGRAAFTGPAMATASRVPAVANHLRHEVAGH